MFGSKYSNNALLGAVITLGILYALLGNVLNMVTAGSVIIVGVLAEIINRKKRVTAILPIGAVVAWAGIFALRGPFLALLFAFGPLTILLSWAVSAAPKEEPPAKRAGISTFLKCLEESLEGS
jgi:hypothetical protein